jgi:hypothetical protein
LESGALIMEVFGRALNRDVFSKYCGISDTSALATPPTRVEQSFGRIRCLS